MKTKTFELMEIEVKLKGKLVTYLRIYISTRTNQEEKLVSKNFSLNLTKSYLTIKPATMILSI